MYNRRDVLKAAGMSLAAASLGCLPVKESAADEKYNVVFILADDLGWMDTSLDGSEFFETPNIKRLTEKGMRFTNAYAASPICSPTRASLVTGLWPSRVGITMPILKYDPKVKKGLVTDAKSHEKAIESDHVRQLDQKYYSMGTAFRSNGYATAHIGKWHLGHGDYSPLKHGFDVYFPDSKVHGPYGGYLGPWKFWPGKGKPGEHIDERLAHETAQYIKDNKDKPFMVNFWMYSVHDPWQTKTGLLKKYESKVDMDNPKHNPVYGGMVETLDKTVGIITDAIEEAGIADKTIIVFFSDNGGHIQQGRDKYFMHEEKYRKIPITDNAPLRGGKGYIYEGGTREPLVIVWPGKVKPGSVNDKAIVQSIDFLPTFAGMCDLKLPGDVKFDGIDFTPALFNRKISRDTIFCHAPHYYTYVGELPSTYVRKGDWKLIRFYCEGPDQTDLLELYNLKDDIGETNNLASKYPRKVKQLNKLIDEFLKDSEAVVPIPNPDYVPAENS